MHKCRLSKTAVRVRASAFSFKASMFRLVNNYYKDVACTDLLIVLIQLLFNPDPRLLFVLELLLGHLQLPLDRLHLGQLGPQLLLERA